jgi:hypothetical protein
LRLLFVLLDCASLAFLRLRVVNCAVSLLLTALLLLLLPLLFALQDVCWAAPRCPHCLPMRVPIFMRLYLMILVSE